MPKKQLKPSALRYTGNGTFLPGVPARDLSADEAELYDYARLIASGIYQPIDSEVTEWQE
jgi:hypothetical protein